MNTNIFEKIFKGEQVASVGVLHKFEIDNATLVRLFIMLFLLIVLSLLTKKLTQ